jgi:hypothetical protein
MTVIKDHVEDVEKLKPLRIAVGEEKWYSYLEKCRAVYQKVFIKYRVTIRPDKTIFRYSIRNENVHPCKICTQVFIAALFIVAQNGNNPNSHQLMSG